MAPESLPERRALRVLQAVRRIDRLIIESNDPQRLVAGACDALVESLGYHDAWIALFDECGGVCDVVSSEHGRRPSDLEPLLAGGDLPEWATRAVSDGGVVVVNGTHVGHDPSPPRTNDSDHTVLASRLEHSGRVHGVLVVTAPAEHRTSENDHIIFLDLADDLGYALEKLASERALKASEAKMESIYRAAPVGIGLVNGRAFVEVNQRFCDMVGYEREELIGNNARMIYASDEDYEYVGRVKHAEVEKHGHGTVETRLLSKNGRFIDVVMSSSYLDPARPEAGMTFTVLDITDRAQSERLRAAQVRIVDFATGRSTRELLQRFLDEAESLTRSNVGFFHFVDESDQSISLQTWSANTLANMCSVEGMETHYDMERAGVWADAVRRRQPVVHNDYDALDHKRGLPPGHASIERELVVPVLRGESIVAVLGVGNKATDYDEDDVSVMQRLADLAWEIVARQRTEEELDRERIRAEEYLSLTGAIMLALDNEGRVTMMNRSGCELLGMREADILGLSWFESFVADEDRDSAWKSFRTAIDGEPDTEERFERAIITADGDVRRIAWHRTVLRGPDGGIVGLLNSGEDLTELKAKDAQLQQAQKMEAVGRLAAGVAHDFNNQLTVIHGYAELLMAELPEDDEGRPSVDQIIKAAQRARSTTDHLLSFSRRRVLEPEMVDPGDLLRGIEKPVSRIIGEDIRLTVAVPPGVWPLHIDRSGLEQVLMNLIVNARDAMNSGGTLVLKAANARPGDEILARLPQAASDRFVRLDITDSGCGMDQDTLDRLFEPFYTTKELGKGTGLGMPMVLGFVQQSQGHILVDSDPGRGTTVTILLPISEVAEEIPASRTVDGDHGGHREASILVVEDESGVRAFMVRILEQAGYRVTAAESPAHALQVLSDRELWPDLIVSDIVMPGMRGDEMVEILSRRGLSIPVLFVTGYSETSTADHVILRKPFQRHELLRGVRESIGQAISGLRSQPGPPNMDS